MSEQENDVILEVRNLKKHFGGIKAVDGIDMDIEKGSITGLIGPNGAGKTTTFNCISGFLERDDGKVYFQGDRIDGLPPHEIYEKGIVRSFQITRPLNEMTVLENLLMAGRDRESEKFFVSFFKTSQTAREEKEQTERAMEIMDLVELTDKKDEITRNLSGGQKRILEFARTVMAEPDLVMLDEPSSGLNRELKEKLLEYIIDINEEFNQSFLVVGHDMNFIMRLCDPIYVMHQGNILMKGKPEEVQQNEEVIDIYLGRA